MKNNIEFIDYDGGFPCLCMGTLKVKINGKEVIFSDSGEYCEYDEKKDKMIYKENCYPTFWASGGRIVSDGDWGLSAEYGEWYTSITTEKYPQEILDMMDDLIKIFNDNVPQGCCGGCI